MPQPTIYLDTAVISSYWYDGANVISQARRIATRVWWDSESKHFEVWASRVTEEELRGGWYPRQAQALAMVRRLRFLPLTGDVRQFADRLLEAKVVPDNKPRDALQMAVATVHEMDYLLTWNYAHLANVTAQQHLEKVCRRCDSRRPLLVSPETIAKVSLGQSLRRKKRAGN
jgi:hypothetical protein